MPENRLECAHGCLFKCRYSVVVRGPHGRFDRGWSNCVEAFDFGQVMGNAFVTVDAGKISGIDHFGVHENTGGLLFVEIKKGLIVAIPTFE